MSISFTNSITNTYLHAVDMKPLPTTLLVAIAIIVCVFGFGLIVNLLTGKKKKQ